jgi:succinoglycan biosynthesis protein ExoA
MTSDSFRPRYTVIVPMAHFQPDEPVLASLRATPAPAGGLQVIVAQGIHPARQRNLAVAQARGEVVVFLDNDCSLGEGYWAQVESAFARPEVEIVGGPALLRPGAGAWEKIFHALLTHPLVVGGVAARYAAWGTFRAAKQTDLILCNLAVHRATFARIGPLSNDLYPNEENEWLDRAHAAGLGAYYDPALQVFRPQRGTPRSMMLTLLRYGIGRTRQFRVSRWRFTFHQVLPVILLTTLLLVITLRLEWEFALLWLVAAIVIAATCDSSLHGWRRVVAGLIGPAVPLVYALGQLVGWILVWFPGKVEAQEIKLLDEKGETFSQAGV